MTEKTTGIAGNQASRATKATGDRNARKGGLKKSIPAVIVLVAVVFPLLFLWRSYQQEEKVASVPSAGVVGNRQQQKAITLRAGAGLVPAKAEWDALNPDGTIPVGVRSKTVELPYGCGADFPHGQDTYYRVYGRYYHRPEKPVTISDTGPFSHLSFEITEKGAGMKELPFTYNCP